MCPVGFSERLLKGMRILWRIDRFDGGFIVCVIAGKQKKFRSLIHTRGASMTCAVMCGNGLGIGMVPHTPPAARVTRKVHRRRRLTGWCVAVVTAVV